MTYETPIDLRVWVCGFDKEDLEKQLIRSGWGKETSLWFMNFCDGLEIIPAPDDPFLRKPIIEGLERAEHNRPP